MLNVMVAFRVWGPQWQDESIKVYCDNAAVVSTLNTGRTRDNYLAACARTLWLIKAKYNIKVIVEHIQGTKNIYADTLSRWHHFCNVDNDIVRQLKSCAWIDIQKDSLNPDISV